MYRKPRLQTYSTKTDTNIIKSKLIGLDEDNEIKWNDDDSDNDKEGHRIFGQFITEKCKHTRAPAHKKNTHKPITIENLQ